MPVGVRGLRESARPKIHAMRSPPDVFCMISFKLYPHLASSSEGVYHFSWPFVERASLVASSALPNGACSHQGHAIKASP